MDTPRFDGLTRAFGSRRAALGSASLALAATLGLTSGAASKKK